MLIDHSQHIKGEKYPWDIDLINQGVLEREHARYLLKHNPFLSSVRNRDEIGITSLPDFGQSYLKHNQVSEDVLNRLEMVFDAFIQNDSYAHLFILGQTIHWVTILVNKVKGHHEFILCDSRNIFVLNSEETFIRDLLVKRCQKTGTIPTKDSMEKYFDSCTDITWTLQIIRDCIIHKKSVTSLLIHFYVEAFVELFQNEVEKKQLSTIFNQNEQEQPTKNENQNNQMCHDEERVSDLHKQLDRLDAKNIVHEQEKTYVESLAFMSNLSVWLRDYSPPSIIEDYFIHHLSSFKHKVHTSTVEIIKTWCHTTKHKISVFSQVSSFTHVEHVKKNSHQHLYESINSETIERFSALIERLHASHS